MLPEATRVYAALMIRANTKLNARTQKKKKKIHPHIIVKPNTSLSLPRI